MDAARGPRRAARIRRQRRQRRPRLDEIGTEAQKPRAWQAETTNVPLLEWVVECDFLPGSEFSNLVSVCRAISGEVR